MLLLRRAASGPWLNVATMYRVSRPGFTRVVVLMFFSTLHCIAFSYSSAVCHRLLNMFPALEYRRGRRCFRAHTHTHTRQPIIFPRCSVDFFFPFVDFMVFLFSGALKTTYEAPIIFLFILFATRIRKRCRCRDSSYSDECIEY